MIAWRFDDFMTKSGGSSADLLTTLNLIARGSDMTEFLMNRSLSKSNKPPINVLWNRFWYKTTLSDSYDHLKESVITELSRYIK